MKKTIYLLLLVLLTSAAGFLEEPGYQVGDTAADFKLKNVDGKMVSLAGMSDAKGFIVIFTCNHCPYSVAYEDRIIALHKKYAAKGYPVVAINPNDAKRQPEDSFEEMQKRAQEKGFDFPYLYDETQEIAKTFGAARTPHVFVLNKEADELKVAYIGAIDNNTRSAADADKKFTEDAVNSLLAGKKPDTNFTKAVGCTVKWAAE